MFLRCLTTPDPRQAMDLDSLIHQLNNVEPKAINWQALADCSAPPSAASSKDGNQAATATSPGSALNQPSAGWSIATDLQDRLCAYLRAENLAGDQAAATRILNEALDTWLSARGA